jgi:hypothetical protein
MTISRKGFKQSLEYLAAAVFRVDGRVYAKTSDFIIDSHDRKYLSALEKYGALTRAGTISELMKMEIKIPAARVASKGGAAVVYEIFPAKIEELKEELNSSGALSILSGE